jgi:hypothetical protein
MNTHLEKITIVEGPTPDFEKPYETWLPALAEGPVLPQLAMCRLRTFNGPALVERCWKAWNKEQPIYLEFRAADGLTKYAQILAARSTQVEEGQMLMLYVNLATAQN